MERKRQQRGMERMESLLEAAALVFAELGYDRATTNLIAARAGVSPGSLYQFFPHKAAMAEALASRYAANFEAVHAKVLTEGIEKVELGLFIDLVVDPFLAFHRDAPAFETLLSAGVMPGNVEVLKQAFARRLAELFTMRCPKANPKEMQVAVEVSMGIFNGLLPLLTKGSPASKRRAVVELKCVLERYLAPILDDGSRVR
ncbi:MAG: TetR/AcrR family transcriptional regulator [Acidobacteria bacterium]|nr:TetR/AcrR family transcriptional regulator [Acidobacteriota bacterium]